MLPYTLRQLRQVCNEAPWTPKILLAPRRRSGHILTGALARHGVTWTHLTVRPVVDLAADLTEVQRLRSGGRRLGAEPARLLVSQTLGAHAPEATACFGTIAPSTVDVLWRLLSQLRCGDLDRDALRDAPHTAPLACLLHDYETRLDEGSWWDEARLLWQAVASSTPDESTLYIVLDETDLSPAAQRLIEILAGSRLRRIGRHDYGTPTPSRWASSCLPATPLAEAPASSTEATAPTRTPRSSSLVQGDLFLDHLLDTIHDPGAKGRSEIEVAPGGRLLTTGIPAGAGDRIRVWETVGQEVEIRAVLRDLLDRDLAFDTVEIAYPVTGGTYAALLLDTVQRFDLPAQFVDGTPVTATRAGRGAMALLQWLASGLQGRALVAGLQSGDIPWPGTGRVGPVLDALLLGRIEAGAQAAGDALRRAAALEGHDRQAKGDHAPAVCEEALQRLHAWLPDDVLSLTGLATAVAAALTDLLPGEQGTQQVVDALQRLAECTDAELAPRADQAERLILHLRRWRIGAGEPGPGQLSIAPLAEAGYAHREHLYIIGLSETHFPAAVASDPVLSARQLQAMSLSQPDDRSRADVAHLIRLLGGAGHVTLCAHRLALANGREPYPSPLFALASQQLDVEPERQAMVHAEGLGCDDLERALAMREALAHAPTLEQAFPDAVQGHAAQRARARGISRFDGWIGADVEVMDRARPWSARRLEDLAECPRRALWRDGVGLRAIDLPERDPRRWLTPPEMGALLHGLFLEFMQHLRESGQTPTSAHAPLLEHMTAAAIEAMQQRVPVVHAAAFGSDCRRIERAAQVFLQAEAQHFADAPGLTPVAFERDFGEPAQPVTVMLGGESMSLLGRIDRIDRRADGGYEIWDYKTGSTYGFDHADLLAGGRRLQWVLYAWAVELLEGGGTVTSSGYLFASERGGGERFAAPPPSPDQVSVTLAPLMDLVRAGLYPAAHKREAGSPCRFCDFRRLCESEGFKRTDLDARRETLAQWSGLVEGWAQTRSAGRRQASDVVEARLREAGLRIEDIGPLESVDLIAAWLDA